MALPIENPLNEPGATLVRDTYKWRDARQERCRTQPAGILDRKGRVFKIDQK